MSPKMPVFKPIELIRLLEKHGFDRAGQKGSHVKMRDSGATTIVIPDHKGPDISYGLACDILKRAGIDPNSLRR
jgi:predicted RNA binding protein YcfA (HicA-like mRNA interferase family)